MTGLALNFATAPLPPRRPAHRLPPNLQAAVDSRKCLCAVCLAANPERRLILIRERAELQRRFSAGQGFDAGAKTDPCYPQDSTL